MSGTAPFVDAHALRFGVNIGWMTLGGALPVEAARSAEASGFDIVTAADHVGAASPFVVLAAAAAVTERVRLRTYVLDYGFWNAGLLARDVATLDAVSGGRVELGLGIGYLKHEYDAVGLDFAPYAERLTGLAAFAEDLRRRLADAAHSPRPAQQHVPVLVGGMSERGLTAAAAVADVVALAGMQRLAGQPPGAFRLLSSAETDQRVAWLDAERSRLGRPLVPHDVLLQQVVVDRDPQESAAELAGESEGRFTAVELLDTPFLLFASSPEEAAAELRRRSRRWGIGTWCTHAPSGPPLARVIEVLRS